MSKYFTPASCTKKQEAKRAPVRGAPLLFGFYFAKVSLISANLQQACGVAYSGDNTRAGHQARFVSDGSLCQQG
jgi:hypothetical protein